MITNPEKLLASYLRADSAVATLVERRVVAKTPDTLSDPWVRLTILDDSQDPNSPHDHLRTFYFQLDCYAGAEGGQPEALALAAAVRAAIVAIDQAIHDDAVVSSGRINGFARIPDVDLEPARERVIITATVWAHEG